jgi:hypothetical protein
MNPLNKVMHTPSFTRHDINAKVGTPTCIIVLVPFAYFLTVPANNTVTASGGGSTTIVVNISAVQEFTQKSLIRWKRSRKDKR